MTARAKIKAVDETTTIPPATCFDALDAAVAKAKTSGASVFVLAWQVGDEAIEGLSYPPAEAFKQFFIAHAHDVIHGVEGRDGPDSDWILVEDEEC